MPLHTQSDPDLADSSKRSQVVVIAQKERVPWDCDRKEKHSQQQSVKSSALIEKGFVRLSIIIIIGYFIMGQRPMQRYLQQTANQTNKRYPPISKI